MLSMMMILPAAGAGTSSTGVTLRARIWAEEGEEEEGDESEALEGEEGAAKPRRKVGARKATAKKK